MSERPTPRTDAECWPLSQWNHEVCENEPTGEVVVNADFARALERENAELREELKEQVTLIRKGYNLAEMALKSAQISAENHHEDPMASQLIKGVIDMRREDLRQFRKAMDVVSYLESQQ